MLKVFEKSSAELGNTIEGNANNVALTYGNIFANFIGDNAIEVDSVTGQIMPVQELTIDPITGKKLSELNIKDKTAAINLLKRRFINETRDQYIMQVFRESPELLKTETIQKITSELPVYDTVDAGQAALNSGEFFIVDGRLKEAE